MIRTSVGILTLLLSLSACSSTSKALKGEGFGILQEGPFAFRSEYVEKTGSEIETIAIMGINDFHGALAPVKAKTRETPGIEPVSYETGGAAWLGAHVRIQQSKHGSRFLLLDAGDEYQGSIESNLAEGKPVVDFFNQLGVTAASIGNHEFDYGPVGPEGTPGDPLGALKARMAEAKYPYLAANILEKKTRKPPELPNTFPSKIFQAGKLKVGVIGLTTQHTPVTTRAANVEHLDFVAFKEPTIREAKRLRKGGADVIVITAHVGLFCQPGKNGMAHALRSVEEGQGDCGEKDEMVALLRSLPKGTIDAVVAGHSHQVIYHYVAGVPVIQGGSFGRFYNLIHLTYDRTKKKVVPELTRIEGPIPVCAQFFENQSDCNGDRPAPKNGRGDLVEAKLYGDEVEPDEQVEKLLKPVFARSDEEKKRVVGHAHSPLEHFREQESPLGNVVSDALLARAKVDAVVVNAGGIRAPIEAGDITFGDVFRSFPFDNSISVLDVTGSELKKIVQVAESGMRGFFPVSGIVVKLIDLKHTAPSSDLNGDRKIETWEIDRVLDVRFADGSPVQDKKHYRLATIDFLVTGGDDMGWVFSQVPKSRVTLDSGGLVRDAVLDHLARVNPINTVEQPVVDPKKPRFIRVEPPRGKRIRRR